MKSKENTFLKKNVYLHALLEEHCMYELIVFVGPVSYREKVIQVALSIIA